MAGEALEVAVAADAGPDGRFRAALRFGVRAAALMAIAYGLLFFPYAADSPMVRAEEAYLRGLAALVGALLAPFDSTISVEGTLIAGRFPLHIVLDCAALDVEALFAAAVIAFPAPVRHKLLAVPAGLLALALVNLARIALLYFIGVKYPAQFAFLHEEVLQLFLVFIAGLLFAGFVVWSARSAGARA